MEIHRIPNFKGIMSSGLTYLKELLLSLLFSHSHMSNSLRHCGLQHPGLPCPSLSPTGCANSCLLSQMMPANIPSSSISPCFSCSQSSHVRVFTHESVLHIRQPKYWSFSLIPSNEQFGLVPIGIDWVDFLAVQGTLKSHLQYHSSKASVPWHSAFFIVKLSHPYVSTGKQKQKQKKKQSFN